MKYFKGCGVLTAENMAAIKVAIEICNNPELKKEILCAFDEVRKPHCISLRKEEWNDRVESKARSMLRNLPIPEKLQEKIMGVVLPIGMRMLTWAEYHEGTLGFSREYSINFLNGSLFEPQGIVDNKKAAEELMNGGNMSIEQKYKLACLYCFTDHIPALYRQMTKEYKDAFFSTGSQWLNQPGLVTFWSNYLTGKIDKRKEKTLDLYRLEKAVESGSKAAVEYCFQETRRNGDFIVNAALKTVRNWLKTKWSEDDWFVFRDERYDGSKGSWIPSDYDVDILCFLLSQMDESQQLEFLKRDIDGAKYKSISIFEVDRRSRVLALFLDWPYQNYFMMTAEIMWEFLPESDYANLLLRICRKIQGIKGPLKYGEEKSFDYRGLLKEYWYQSPHRFKRYVFSKKDTGVTGAGLLMELIKFKKFTYKDRQNVRLILDSATDEEKECIIYSEEWTRNCTELIRKERWEMLNRVVLNCFSCKEDADMFKRDLIFTVEVQCICANFLGDDKLSAAEYLINWSFLPGEEVSKLKWKIIHSEDGLEACEDVLLYCEKVQLLDTIVRWCITSEEDVNVFKKNFVFSAQGAYICRRLVTRNKLELLNEFINLCGLCSEAEIREFRKSVAYRNGVLTCEELISDYSEEVIYKEQGTTIKAIFKGGKWEEVEQFLTWCFSTEEEIDEFKREILRSVGNEIHFNLIKLNQWEEAETFFAWLGLSAEEIKELKKCTLFHHFPTSRMIRDLMFSKEGDERFSNYGESKQEAVELFLRWFLTDKETVIEFKNDFEQNYQYVNGKYNACFKDCIFMIEQRLGDLEKGQVSVKRKSENFPRNKRLCHLTIENRGTE